MSPEALLLSALTAVTSTLCIIAKLLWARSEQCEKDRIEMRFELERLQEANGLAKGTLISFQNCPEEACPFRPAPSCQPA